MSEQNKTSSESDILTFLESLSNGNIGVTIEHISPFLRNMPENISVTALNQLVIFASDQVGIWGAEWAFSPANAPNTTAKAESARWDKLRAGWVDLLLAQVPDLRETQKHIQEYTEFGHYLKLRLDYNKTKPIQRLSSNILSKISQWLRILGFYNIGKQLYSRALYPKGTVGRTGS
jgi:hypothetical protein